RTEATRGVNQVSSASGTLSGARNDRLFRPGFIRIAANGCGDAGDRNPDPSEMKVAAGVDKLHAQIRLWRGRGLPGAEGMASRSAGDSTNHHVASRRWLLMVVFHARH